MVLVVVHVGEVVEPRGPLRPVPVEPPRERREAVVPLDELHAARVVVDAVQAAAR